jgi:two-component system sensor histidine kinase UhpB
VGFIAALRWQMKETCGRAGLECNEYFPAEEPELTADAGIALFRIAQESFANIMRLSAAKTMDVTMDVDEDTVVFRITEDGCGISDPASESDAHVVASMRHRIRALGGTFDMSVSPSGGVLDVRIPAARALKPLAETERA